jgi:hypothetical protein
MLPNHRTPFHLKGATAVSHLEIIDLSLEVPGRRLHEEVPV